MHARYRTRPRGEGGFTISELLLVVGVFAALIAIVVWSVNGITKDSDERTCRNELRAIKAASERFNAELGQYPSNLDELFASDFVQPEDIPDYRVQTDINGDPEYIPVGSRCR